MSLDKLNSRLAAACPAHVFPVKDFDIVDGDTVKTVLDLSFYVQSRGSCRVFGVDTPEKRTVAGPLVAQCVGYWFAECDLKSLRCISLARDKFGGRFVGTFFPAENKPETLSHWLLGHGLARPYGGGRKAVWTSRELDQIAERARDILSAYSPPEQPLKIAEFTRG